MNLPIIKDLNISQLANALSGLATKGRLAISDNNLVYLDISDHYINRLFLFLENQKIKKPDYFGIGGIGAHISVIYPEENIGINRDDVDKEHEFKVKSAFTAEIGLKKYYALKVDAPSLLLLRRKYHLSDMLPFKGYSISFHITIGVQRL
ncbi:MAG: uncharacterized protein K0S27_1433 [Gammaproteobacteria bacterium]|jgi:hypothetical protein|nr:uncharacterized protein [Gammaproteobacteria bacterium]